MPFAFGGNSGDFSWDSFKENYANINRAAAASGRMYTDVPSTAGPSSPYFANQGTDYMFNGKYRPANMAENALINIHRAGDELMNWQAGIAGLFGGEQAKEDWTFNPDKFKLGDWTGNQGWENMNQIKNFAVSLPGQMVGGLIQAPGQLLGEVVAGTPYTEYKKSTGAAGRRAQNLNEPEFDANGNYLIPEYTLDAQQRLGQAVNAGINIAGTFTGGTGKAIGTLGKAAFTRSVERQLLRNEAANLGRALTSSEEVATREGFRTAMRNADFRNIDLEATARRAGLSDADAVNRARSWQRKAENWERRSKGFLTRGYERATGKDISQATLAAQIGLDALEEGGEEFIQEYAERGARYKQDVKLDEALTSAAWGMLGGGLMSGGISAVNYTRSRSRANNAQAAANTASAFAPPTVNHGMFIDLTQANSQHMSSDVREQIQKKQNQRYTRFSPGSSAKIVQIDNNIAPGEADVGDMVFQSAVKRGGEALSEVANDHNMTNEVAIQIAENPEEFREQMLQAGNADAVLSQEQINRGQTAWTTADALNWYEAHNGFNNYDMLITRSPATKSGGRHAIKRRKYIHNASISMHAGVFQKIGSDLDGDMDCIFYGNVNRWGRAQRVSDQLMWAETYTNFEKGREEGKSATDWYFYGIVPDYYRTDDGQDIISQHFRSILGIFDRCRIDNEGNLILDAQGNIDINATSGEAFSDYYINQFNECMHENDDYWDNDYRNWRLSVLFDNLVRNTNVAISQSAFDQNGYVNPLDNNSYVTPRNGESVWGDLMLTFNTDDNEVIGKMMAYYEEGWRHSLENDINAFKQNRNVTPVNPDFNGPSQYSSYSDLISEDDLVNIITTRGTLDGTEIAYNFEALGLLAYSLNKKGGTVIFRQSGELYYDAQSFPDSFWSSLNQFRKYLPQDNTMLKTFVRANFHMYASGLQPKSAVEGKIDAMILSETLRKANINESSKINNKEKLNDFENALAETLSEYNKVYNQIMRNQGAPFVARTENVEVGSQEFYSAFQRIFEYTPSEAIIDGSLLSEEARGYNIGGIWDHYISGINDLSAISLDENINDFFIKAKRSFRSMGISLENSFKSTLESFNKEADIEMIVERAANDPNHNYGDDIHTVVNFVYFINDILGYDIAIRANIIDENGMLTEFGRRLAHDSKDWVKFKRDLVAISIYTQLNPYIEEYLDPNTSRRRRAQLREYFETDIASINPLHAQIIDEVIDNGTHMLFDVLTNLDNDFAFVERFFDLSYSDADRGFNLFIDSLMSEKTEFDYSGVSNRVRKAQSHLKTAVKLLPKHCAEQVETIFSSDKRNNGPAYRNCVVQFLQRQAQTNRFALDPSIFADSVLESMNLPHASVEKAVENDITTGKGVALKHQENGGPVSYQEEHFAWHTGIIPLEQARTNPAIYLALWANPRLELVVEDAKTGRINRHYSLKNIFEAAGIQGEFNGPDGHPSFEQCQAYFRADPTKISMFSDFTANIYDGNATRSAEKTVVDSLSDFEEAMLGMTTGLDKDLERQFTEYMYDTQRWLSNQVEYESYLIGCCSDLIEKQAPNWVIAERVKKVHEDTVISLTLETINAQDNFGGNPLLSETYNSWRRATTDRIAMMPSYMEGMLDRTIMLTTRDIGTYRNTVFHYRYSRMEHDLFERISENLPSSYKAPVFVGEYDQVYNHQEQQAIHDRNNQQYQRIAQHLEIYRDYINYIYEEKLRQDNSHDSQVEFADDFVDNTLNQIINANIDENSTVTRDNNGNIISVSDGNGNIIFDQNDIEDLRNGISEASEQIQESYNSSARGARSSLIITPDSYEEYNQNRQQFIADLLVVYENYIGEALPYGKRLDKLVDDALRNKKSFDEFCDELVWRSLETQINYFNKMTNSDENANDARATERCVKFFDRALSYSSDADSIAKEIGGKIPSGNLGNLNRWAQEKFGNRLKLHKPNFSSKTVQFMCSRNMSMNSFGGGMNDVSTNGLENRYHIGYDFLPQFDNVCSQATSSFYYYDRAQDRYVSTDITPRTIRDMVVSNPHMRYEKIIVPGEEQFFNSHESNNSNNWHAITIQEAFNRYGWDTETDPNVLDQPLMWFNPYWNPHGLSRENSREMNLRATNQSYRQLSDVIARIDSATMEDLVLKLKKNMGKKNKIVDKIKYNLLRRHSIHTQNDWGFASDSANINAYRNFLTEVRKEYSEMINYEFTEGKLSGIGCGFEQAKLLACNFTPGLILHGSNGETLYIDAYDIFCEEQFGDEILAGIQALGEIADVEVCTITPNFQSMAIARNVRSSVNEQSTQAEYHDAALEALRFSNLDEDTLPISDITNHMAPYGYHYDFKRPLSADQSSYQDWLEYQDPAQGTSTTGVRNEEKSKNTPEYSRPNQNLSMLEKGEEFEILAKEASNTCMFINEQTGEIEDSISGIMRIWLPEADNNGNITVNSSTIGSTNTVYNDWTSHLNSNLVSDNKYSKCRITTRRTTNTEDIIKDITKHQESVGLVLRSDKQGLREALAWSEETGNDIIIPASALADYNEDLINKWIRFGVINRVYSEGSSVANGAFRTGKFYRIRAINRRNLPTQKENPRYYSESNFQRDRLRLYIPDIGNIFNIGDGMGMLFEPGEDLGYSRGDTVRVDMHHVLRGYDDRPMRIATIDEVNTLYNELNNENWTEEAWRDSGINFDAYVKPGRDHGYYLRSTRRLLTALSSSNQNVDLGDDMGSAKPICLITDGFGHFAPIITPSNSANRYDYCTIHSMEGDGSNLFLTWHAADTLGNAIGVDGQPMQATTKASQGGDIIAFKGNIGLMPDVVRGIKYMTPTIGVRGFEAYSNGDSGADITMVNSLDTEEGRAVGQDKRLFISLLYNLDRAAHGSHIFKLKDDAPIGSMNPNDYVLVPFIANQIKNNEARIARNSQTIGWTQEDLLRFLQGDDTIAWKVVDGTLAISEDTDVNSVIKEFLFQQLDNKRPWLYYITDIGYDKTGGISPNEDLVNTKRRIFFNGKNNEYMESLFEMSYEELQLFFYGKSKFQMIGSNHVINSLTAHGNQTIDQYYPEEGKPQCLIDPYGNTWYTMQTVGGEGVSYFWPLRAVYISPNADWGSNMSVGDEGSVSFQNSIMNGLSRADIEGYRSHRNRDDEPGELWKLANYSDFVVENMPNLLSAYRENALHLGHDDDWVNPNTTEANREINEDLRRSRYGGFREYRHQNSVRRQNMTLEYRRKITESDGSTVISKEEDIKRYNDLISRIRNVFQWDNMPVWIIDNIIKMQDGFTYTYGTGNNNITLDAWCKVAEQVIANVRDNQFHFPVVPPGGHLSKEGRAAIPIFTNDTISLLVNNAGIYRNTTVQEFENYMYRAVEQAMCIMESELHGDDRIKMVNYLDFIEYVHRVNHRPFDNTRYIMNGLYEADYVRAVDEFCQLGLGGLFSDFDSDTAQFLHEQVERNREKQRRYRVWADRTDLGSTINDPNSPTGSSSIEVSHEQDAAAAVLNNMTRWVQALAVMDPYLIISNTGDRVIHQTVFTKLLNSARSENPVLNRLSPYQFIDRNHAWTDEELDQLVDQPGFLDFYAEVRRSGFNGELPELLAAVSENGIGIQQYLEQKKAERKKHPFMSVTDKLFEISAGGRIGLKQQAKIFFQRYIMFAEEQGHDYLFEEDPNTGEMLIKSQVRGDGAVRWFAGQLGAYGDTVGLQVTMNALQSAYSCDLAQRHTGAAVLEAITRRTTAGKFVTTTMVSKFPNFGFNITDRTLNWILPMSSIYYVLTENLAMTNLGEEIQAQDLQRHKNLLEAVKCDILHLGFTSVAMILLAMSGAVEPPDDDRYMCNVEEWLIFGKRVREEWWIQDILGPILPVITFARSCQLGKPMFSLIVDGTVNACYNNPFMRATDVLQFFNNEEGGLWAQYKRDKEDYAEAPGGGPDDFLEFMREQANVGVWKWSAQLFTPAFVRELGRMGEEEHSYKTIYKRSPTGVVEHDETKTEKVSYHDAMIRKMTRSNPMLGLIFDLMPGNNSGTGYLEKEMPRTVYYDDAQLNSSKENDGKTALEILSVIQRYENNMDALKETGFYLSKEKKAEVSQLIWDMYYQAKTDWNEFAGSDGADFYTLGEGDFDLGRQRYYQVKETYQQMQQYWYKLYNNCIKYSYLSKPMQMYYRSKTTYDLDANGEVYATGFDKATSFPIPFSFAPGTLTDPQGTAGYENNFNTISAVTGKATGQRALIPIPGEFEEWPDFESWSEDGSGNSFSANNNGKSSNNSSSDSGNKSNKKASSGYGSRGGSGGGRSGGSSGGGRSGGSAPRIYASNATVNPVSPSRLMNSNRIQNTPDIDYLRPGFETKGSREAYKRGDI